MFDLRNSTLRRFASRYATFAAARIALVVGRWFVLVQSTRHLPVCEFAALAAALSAVEILRAISDIGADGFVYSRLGNAGQRLRVTVRAALLLRAGMALLVTVIGAFLYHRGISADLRLLPVFALILATTAQSTSVALLQKAARFKAMTTLVAITLSASVLVDAASVLLPVSLSLMSFLLVTPDFVAAIAAAVLAGRQILNLAAGAGKARRSLAGVARILSGKLLPGAAIAVLVMLYSRLDIVIVRPFAGPAAQANYSAGFRLVEPVFLFFAIASLALLAELGSGRTNDTRSLGRVLTGVRPFWLMMLMPAASILSAAIASNAASELFGLNVMVSHLAGIFAAAIPFRVANSMMTAVLSRLGRFDIVMNACVLNGIITFVLAALLVTKLGAPGAACAALFAEIINTVIQRYALMRQTETGLEKRKERHLIESR